jgi:hypothetical protein
MPAIGGDRRIDLYCRRARSTKGGTMRRRFYLAACLLRAPQAGAASVDCAKASRPVERLICGDPALSAAVEVLADADAVATVLGPQIIRADQRAWMTQCDKLAKAVDLVAAYSDRTAGNRRAPGDGARRRRRRGREGLSARSRGGNGPRLRGARIDKVVIFWAGGADDFTAISPARRRRQERR